MFQGTWDEEGGRTYLMAPGTLLRRGADGMEFRAVDPCYPAQAGSMGTSTACHPRPSHAPTNVTRLLGSGVTYTLSSLRNHRRFEACMLHGGVASMPLLQALLATWGFDAAALDRSPFVRLQVLDTQWSGCVLSVNG